MTDDEKLIEEAAKAIFAEEHCDRHQKRNADSITENWEDRLSEADKDEYRSFARAALAVFEKAHTPTAIWSEKEVPPLIRELRMSQGDGSDWTEDLFARAADALEAAEKAHTPTTPSDDEREALVTSAYGVITSHYWSTNGKPGVCAGCGDDIDAQPGGTMAEHRAQKLFEAGLLRRSEVVPEPSADDEREARAIVRRAVGGVLFHVTNFPERAQSRILGENMGPLNEKITDAVLSALRRSEPSAEDQGLAANCHLCVGAGGHEGYDGEWVECSCQRAQGEPSDAMIREAVLKGLAEASVFQSPFAFQTRELVVEQVTLALRAASEVGGEGR